MMRLSNVTLKKLRRCSFCFLVFVQFAQHAAVSTKQPQRKLFPCMKLYSYYSCCRLAFFIKQHHSNAFSSAPSRRCSPMLAQRMRHHVNPLARKHSKVIDLPVDWVEKVFLEPHQNFHIDIGSGYGNFCISMARKYPSWNFLGLEIRPKVAAEATRRLKNAGLTNCHFLCCNANINLERLMEQIKAVNLRTSRWPYTSFHNYGVLEYVGKLTEIQNLRCFQNLFKGTLKFPRYFYLRINALSPIIVKTGAYPFFHVSLFEKQQLLSKCSLLSVFAKLFLPDVVQNAAIKGISIQFPDPQFRRRHYKRRVCTPELVHTLAKHLSAFGYIFLQSDIKEVSENMRLLFQNETFCVFRDALKNCENWLDENPFDVPTERERINSATATIYRCLFFRNVV